MASLLLGGCASEPGAPGPAPTEIAAEVRLAGLLPAGAKLTGVAVTPEGQTFVLDQRSGLYELGGATAKLVLATSLLTSRFGLPDGTELTDVVALGNERFALTAENDGYLLDLHGGTLTSYFCYLPSPSGPSPAQVVSVSTQFSQAGIPVKQRTESVAYSPDSLQLFAQPQTLRLDTNEVVGSELFVFAESGGEPTQVRAMASPAFIAGGMLAVDGQSLLLGAGASLYRTGASGAPLLVHMFQTPLEIAGMARATNGNLLLLDGPGQRLLEVRGF